jgi:uncharacterized Zn finger protein
VADISPLAILTATHPYACTARVPSSDGSREYRVLMVFESDPEDERRKGELMMSCTCRAWRLGRGDACKHIVATAGEWRAQREGRP